MTLADYHDMAAYWASHPPLQSLAEAWLQVKPKPVRRRRDAPEPAERPRGESLCDAFPDGVIR